MVDELGRYRTQSLLLELGYSKDAVYSLKEIDYEYKGKLYPSLKRLYLQMSDPTEYQFAMSYFASWDQWQRICANKQITPHVEAWRFEMEVKMRSEGIAAVRKHSKSHNPNAWQAAKWLADKGWDVRGPGRPTKDEVEHNKKVQSHILNEFEQDAERLVLIKKEA